MEHFCSHQHAPNNPDKQFPAVAVKGNIAYIGWDIFNAYANEGHLIFKEIFAYLAERLLGDEASVKVSLPDRGIVTLTRQSGENRMILHLLFAHTTVRGRNTEVIEDTVPLYDIKCSVKAEKAPTQSPSSRRARACRSYLKTVTSASPCRKSIFIRWSA